MLDLRVEYILIAIFIVDTTLVPVYKLWRFDGSKFCILPIDLIIMACTLGPSTCETIEAFLRLAHSPVLSPLKAPFVKTLRTHLSLLKSFSIQKQVVSDLILPLKSNSLSEGKHRALKEMNFNASRRT